MGRYWTDRIRWIWSDLGCPPVSGSPAQTIMDPVSIIQPVASLQKSSEKAMKCFIRRSYSDRFDPIMWLFSGDLRGVPTEAFVLQRQTLDPELCYCVTEGQCGVANEKEIPTPHKERKCADPHEEGLSGDGTNHNRYTSSISIDSLQIKIFAFWEKWNRGNGED